MSTQTAMASACVVLAMACSSEPKRPARDAHDVPSARAEALDEQRAEQARRDDSDVVVPEPAVGDLPPVSAEPGVVENPGPADGTNRADNTGINERDRNDGQLTPLDQGNSGTETEITAAIRKGIMADDSLSFSAKNVKVITVGSKVTLRGPVESKAERSRIESLAKTTDGVSRVDNQLEIKP